MEASIPVFFRIDSTPWVESILESIFLRVATALENCEEKKSQRNKPFRIVCKKRSDIGIFFYEKKFPLKIPADFLKKSRLIQGPWTFFQGKYKTEC